MYRFTCLSVGCYKSSENNIIIILLFNRYLQSNRIVLNSAKVHIGLYENKGYCVEKKYM